MSSMRKVNPGLLLGVVSCVVLLTTGLIPWLVGGAAGALLVAAQVLEPFPCRDLFRLRQIALGSEYGRAVPYLQKWQRNLDIYVSGTPQPADLVMLDRVVAELNQLQSQLRITVVSSAEVANVRLQFLPYREFGRDPLYIPANKGFFAAEQDQGALYQARILIATDQVTQSERNHLLREELTQILGLFNDTPDPPESIFTSRWTQTQHYTAQDRRLIRLLYTPELWPGLPAEHVASAFCGRYFSFRCLVTRQPCQSVR